MIIQIFGKKNCNNTKKVQRFFKERGIKFQFIDICEKKPSKKEFENFLKYYTPEDLLDFESKEYKKRNLQYMVYDTIDLLLESPTLLKTPIIRSNTGVFLGYNSEILKKL